MNIDPNRIARGVFWQRAWSLVSGCTKVSPGCDHCWSERLTHVRGRQTNEKMRARYAGLTAPDGRWNGEIRLNEQDLVLPLRVRKPTVWAIWNDLFHEDVTFDFLTKAFSVMTRCPQHVFLVLTKRPHRMLEYAGEAGLMPLGGYAGYGLTGSGEIWPPNAWAMTTVESQDQIGRLDDLLRVPATVHGVSLEPLLGPVSLERRFGLDRCKWCGAEIAYGIHAKHDGRSSEGRCPTGCSGWWEFVEKGLDWVIVGGETGPGARPMHPRWAQDIRNQCQAAGVPFLFKQWGRWVPYEETAPLDRCEMYEFPDRQEMNTCRHQRQWHGRKLDGTEHNAFPEFEPEEALRTA
ncbi:MAG: phage Gp37/Gp68 family protein [Proteobacteria bacterium]|nr:phage Gp37/Gp68 family protein [Pseudomonadota bacterium]